MARPRKGPRACRLADRAGIGPGSRPRVRPSRAVRLRPSPAVTLGASSHGRVARRGGRARRRARAGGPRSRPVPPTPRPGIVGGTRRLQRTAVGATRPARTAAVCWVAAAGRGSGSKPASRPASRPARRPGTRPVRAGRRLLCATCIRKSGHAADAYPPKLDRPRGFDVYALLSVDPEHGDPNVS